MYLGLNDRTSFCYYVLLVSYLNKSFSSCYLGLSNLIVLLNSISFTCRNAFKHELTLLERVRHPNVVQFVGAVTQNIPMMIVIEHHPSVSSLYFSVSPCSP